jgi:predicted nucleic acid-binding protein
MMHNVTANHAPKISAAALAAATTRLAGAVVLFVEDMTTGPAVYRARLEVFETVDGDQLGADDGTIVVLADRARVDALLSEHGTPGRAAAALTRQLRAEWTA